MRREDFEARREESVERLERGSHCPCGEAFLIYNVRLENSLIKLVGVY